MEPSALATSGLGVVGLGAGAFMAILLCFNKWLEMRRADQTQVGILETDRKFQQERAERAEAKSEEAWKVVMQMRDELLTVKVQNATLMAQSTSLAEEVRHLREENQTLSAKLEDLNGRLK